jgi:hypothetical protein
MRYIVLLVVVPLAAAPLGAITTLLLLPLWRWLEARHGIEAVGHSGPAAWCYGASFLFWLVILGLVGIRMAKRAPHEST